MKSISITQLNNGSFLVSRKIIQDFNPIINLKKIVAFSPDHFGPHGLNTNSLTGFLFNYFNGEDKDY